MAIVFYENTVNPLSANFSLRNGESVREFWLFDDNESVNNNLTAELNDALLARITTILGGTGPAPASANVGQPGGPGSINRIMPMCDPQFYSLFADDVAIRVEQKEHYGQGAPFASTFLKVPPTTTPPSYSAYVFSVKFHSKRYKLLRNQDLVRKTVDFTDPTGTSYRLYYYEEWLRWCIYSGGALDTRVRATIRSGMKFRAPGVTHAGFSVDGAPCDAIPDMSVPDSSFTITWLGVPQRYLDSSTSYLNKYKGYINQTAFSNGRSTWPAGSLLFMGATPVDPYTQVTFDAEPYNDSSDNLFEGTFKGAECVDLQLQFVKTERITDVELLAGSTPNANWIPLGHNLLPHFPSKKFYYVTAQGGLGNADATGQASWVPSYLSVPFEILFQDPNVPNNLFPFGP